MKACTIILILVAYVIGLQQPVGCGLLPSSLSSLNPYGWFYWSSNSSNSSNSKSQARSDDSPDVSLEPIEDKLGYGSRRDGLKEATANSDNVAQDTPRATLPTSTSTTKAPFVPGSILKMFTTTSKPRTNDSDSTDHPLTAPKVKLNKKGRMLDYPLNPVALFNTSAQIISLDTDFKDNRQGTSSSVPSMQTNTTTTNITTIEAPTNATTTATSGYRLTSLFSGWWSRGNSASKLT